MLARNWPNFRAIGVGLAARILAVNGNQRAEVAGIGRSQRLEIIFSRGTCLADYFVGPGRYWFVVHEKPDVGEHARPATVAVIRVLGRP